MINNHKVTPGQYTQITGYVYCQDSQVNTITLNTTPTKLLINSLGANTYEGQLPLDATESLWDATNNKIVPISNGDSGELRVNLEINAKTGSPTVLTYVLDIGGGASPTIVITEDTITLDKTPPYKKSIIFPWFSRETFLANGGQIFLYVDTGTILIDERDIFIKRDHKGR